jgi:hypothetical protein
MERADVAAQNTAQAHDFTALGLRVTKYGGESFKLTFGQPNERQPSAAARVRFFRAPSPPPRTTHTSPHLL